MDLVSDPATLDTPVIDLDFTSTMGATFSITLLEGIDTYETDEQWARITKNAEEILVYLPNLFWMSTRRRVLQRPVKTDTILPPSSPRPPEREITSLRI